MKSHYFALLFSLAVCSAVGHAQTIEPSITIGTHTLTLGMPEQVVLNRLGSEFALHSYGRSSKGTAWAITDPTKQPGSGFDVVGSLFFDSSHRLETVMRDWAIEDTSSSSFFSALDSASKNLERNGLTSCRISTSDKDSSVAGGGSIHVRGVYFDCGLLQVSIEQMLSKSAGVASGVVVTERLLRK